MSFKREIAPDRNLLVADDFQGLEVDSYTKLLLHFQGGDARTQIIDSSPNNRAITAVGNAQLDTAQSKFGGSSLLLDGAGDYLSIPDSDDWNFGTGDFTIDFWVSFNALPIAGHFVPMFSQYADATHYDIVNLYNSAGTYRWYFETYNGGTDEISIGKISPGLSVATWYHGTIVRAGSSWYIFQGGIQCDTTSTNAFPVPNYAGEVQLGKSISGGDYLNGWLDEFRISKGVARWTSNFTPPTAPYGLPNTRWTPLITDGGGALDVAYDRLENRLASHSAGTLVYNMAKHLTSYGFPSSAQSLEILGYLQLPSEGGANVREADLFLAPTNPAAAPTSEANYLRLRLYDNAGTYTRDLLKRISPAAEATIKTEALTHSLADYSKLVRIWLDATNVRVDLDGTEWQAKTAHGLTFQSNQFMPVLYHATSRTSVKTCVFDGFQVRYNPLPVS